MTSITLTKEQTVLWESEVEGKELRVSIRNQHTAGHVEVYSNDGIVLDAWDCEPEEDYWEGDEDLPMFEYTYEG